MAWTLNDVIDKTMGKGKLTIITKEGTFVFCPSDPIPEKLYQETDRALQAGEATVSFEPTKGECNG